MGAHTGAADPDARPGDGGGDLINAIGEVINHTLATTGSPVGQVEVVGHDDGKPADSQDTFLLDDSTLACGQVNDPSSGAQIRVTQTQSLPGVGPTDNGSYLAALATPQQPTHRWWPWALGGGVLVIAVGLVAWMVIRRKRSTDLTASA